MIVGLGDIYVQASRIREASEVMRAIQTQASDRDGCLSYGFAEVIGDPGHFALRGIWEDQAAVDAHYHSREFADYQRSIGPLLSRSSELQLHQVGETVVTRAPSVMDPRDAD